MANSNLNPMQLMQMLRQGNPKAVAQQIIQINYPNDPNMQQLLQLGMKGDTNTLSQIAQQIFSQQGRDFNVELQSLINTTKNL